MCVFALACLPLAYRFASCQKFRHLDPPSKFLASKTFAFLKNWTELEIPNSSNFGFFWKFGFFIGGRAYQRFHEWIQFWAIFWRSWICIASKIWPQSIFQRTVYRTALIFYESMGTFDRRQILGVGFPQICSNFRICFGFYFYGLFHSQSSPRGIS